jgi:hypothetical protein
LAAPFPLMPANRSWQSDVYSRLIEPDVVFTVFRGYLTANLTRRAAAEFGELIRRSVCRTWLIDIMELSDFEARAVVVGNSWWSEFKKYYGQRVLLVSPVPSYHMIAATLGFATGTPVTTFPNLDLAHNYLRVFKENNSGVIVRAAPVESGENFAEAVPWPRNNVQSRSRGD